MLRVFWTMEITDIGDEAIFSIATLLEWNALAVQVKLHHHLWINNHPSTPKSCTIMGQFCKMSALMRVQPIPHMSSFKERQLSLRLDEDGAISLVNTWGKRANEARQESEQQADTLSWHLHRLVKYYPFQKTYGWENIFEIWDQINHSESTLYTTEEAVPASLWWTDYIVNEIMPGYHVHTLPANRPEMGQTAGNGRANYRVNNSPTRTSPLCVSSETKWTWNDLWVGRF